MLRTKKISAAILALSSGLAMAGTMGPICSPTNVTVPCEHSAWDFGIQALYVQQTFNDDLSYLGNYFLPVNGVNNQSFVDNDIRWGWGFKLEGSYHFKTGNDVTVNWYHTSDNDRTQNLPYNFFVRSNLDFLPDDKSISTDPKWNAVNVEMGQHVDYGQRVNVRYHGGLHYANLKLNTGARFVGTGSPYTFVAAGESKTNLVGPRLGVDTSYALAKGFSVYANGALAMLVGDNEFNSTTTIVNSTGLPSPASGTTVRNGSKNMVVPQMEGKIGLKYAHPLSQGVIMADAGYMLVNYFNAINSTVIPSNQGATDYSDYGIHGAYFGVKWIGSLA